MNNNILLIPKYVLYIAILKYIYIYAKKSFSSIVNIDYLKLCFFIYSYFFRINANS